jgi:DNA-binding NarL/FixJ family response regulator
VFLDLGLPDRSGLEALTELKHAHPNLPVVVLSGNEDRATVLESIKCGAMGFIPKSSENPELLWHAIKTTISGAVTVPISLTTPAAASAPAEPQSISAASPSPVQAQQLGLTQRQLDVLRLLVQGLPNKSIARRLDIAETTARGYVSELLASFRVTNRTQLVIEVARRGLVLGMSTASRSD